MKHHPYNASCIFVLNYIHSIWQLVNFFVPYGVSNVWYITISFCSSWSYCGFLPCGINYYIHDQQMFSWTKFFWNPSQTWLHLYTWNILCDFQISWVLKSMYLLTLMPCQCMIHLRCNYFPYCWQLLHPNNSTTVKIKLSVCTDTVCIM